MVVLSGLIGIMAGQKRTNLIYIVSYLLMSVLALAAIGLLLIFAATGLARDTDAPHGFFVDQEVRNPDGSNRPFFSTQFSTSLAVQPAKPTPRDAAASNTCTGCAR